MTKYEEYLEESSLAVLQMKKTGFIHLNQLDKSELYQLNYFGFTKQILKHAYIIHIIATENLHFSTELVDFVIDNTEELPSQVVVLVQMVAYYQQITKENNHED